MSHNVIEIKGELWEFICQNPCLGSNKVIEEFANFGKTIIKKNFGEKNSLELIGVTDIEIGAILFAETVYYDKHPRPKLVNVKKY